MSHGAQESTPSVIDRVGENILSTLQSMRMSVQNDLLDEATILPFSVDWGQESLRLEPRASAGFSLDILPMPRL